MEKIKDYWPIVVFSLGVISTMAVGIYSLKMLENHNNQHCTELKALRQSLSDHIGDPNLHYTQRDRETARDHREDVKNQLDKIDLMVMELTRYLMQRENR